MQPWAWIAIAVGAFLAYEAFEKYETASTLDVNVVGIDLSNFPTVNVTLSVQNVTNNSLTINSLAATMSVSGTSLGNISSTTPVTLAPNAITNITLQLSVGLLTLPTAILNVINNLSGSLPFNITGDVNVAGVPAPVPININQTFSV